MGIRIVNNSPFNLGIRVGMRVQAIGRHSVWTCPAEDEQAIDYRTVDKRHLQVVKVSDEERDAALAAQAGQTPERAVAIAAEAEELKAQTEAEPKKRGPGRPKKGEGPDDDWPA